MNSLLITDPVIMTAASVLAVALLILFFILRSRPSASINDLPPVAAQPSPATPAPVAIPEAAPVPAAQPVVQPAAPDSPAPDTALARELDRTLTMPSVVSQQPAVEPLPAAPQPIFFEEEITRKLEAMAARIVSLEQSIKDKAETPRQPAFAPLPPEIITQKDIEPLVQRIEAKLELMASDRSSQVMEEIQSLSLRLEGVHKLLIALTEKKS